MKVTELTQISLRYATQFRNFVLKIRNCLGILCRPSWHSHCYFEKSEINLGLKKYCKLVPTKSLWNAVTSIKKHILKFWNTKLAKIKTWLILKTVCYENLSSIFSGSPHSRVADKVLVYPPDHFLEHSFFYRKVFVFQNILVKAKKMSHDLYFCIFVQKKKHLYNILKNLKTF